MSATGDNIRRLRESHGMTQADIAEIAGVTDKAVSTWELGTKEPRMGALQKIADYFGVKKSDIVDDADITKKAPSEDEAEEFERAVNLLFSEHPENLSRLLDALAADPEKTKAKFDLFLATL